MSHPPGTDYARRTSSSSMNGHAGHAQSRTSLSPVAPLRSSQGLEMNGHGHRGAGGHSTSPNPPPPSTSRMALSALVNSPPPRSPPRLPAHSPPAPSHAHYPASSSSSRYSYPPPQTYPVPPPPSDRYPSHAHHSAGWHAYPEDESSRRISHSSYDDEYDQRAHRVGSGTYVSTARIVRDVVPSPGLQGGEDVWEECLRRYQEQREVEAQELARIAEIVMQETYEVQAASQAVENQMNGDSKSGKRKLAQNGDGEKPKPKRKSRAKGVKKAALEDELLGLAEGEDASTIARSSPMPPPSDPFDIDEDDVRPIDVPPETVVYPTGLTRGEMDARIERNDMSGLSAEEIKFVQDQAWKRKKVSSGNAPLRKDGTLRKKPGPSKGWRKRLNGEDDKSSVRDYDSDAGTSIAGDTVNGEAEAEIAALIGDDVASVTSVSKRKSKGRIDEVSEMGLDSDDAGPAVTADDLALSLLEEGTPTATKKRASRAKGAQRSKAKDGSDATQAANALLGLDPHAGDYESSSVGPGASGANEVDRLGGDPYLSYGAQPPVEEYRGISESEAIHRYAQVEELQKAVWAAVVKDVPKAYRVYQAYDAQAKSGCQRKAQSAARNGFPHRSTKPPFKSAAIIKKNAATKGKAIIKELMAFWKKNEKDEMIAKKKADKEALERAKAEEEAREAKRQSRKLNFLLTQTELYSHFIGKKIKTKEAEGEDGEDGPDASAANADLALDDHGEPLPDIDYDDDDEENLRRHAARGAQAAVQAAKDRAKQFDNAGQTVDLDMDGDELNFQNPTLAEDSVTITQPKMLMAQLKEYQLKGLTWLGNLYEQGINGILADEMGLGKTIQSISLLAYLAEHHNMWGPFLVIAPASTLHNWHQELVRFVPRLKPLPYWGSPEERQTLRRPWYKKAKTYSEEDSFHIVVTSYQIAVLDEKYLQSVRWQYMILDEAQAIKSSSSARWKSLLSLNCRNRLLLTGTPIQNSMHELWALLHFIMPSLFDSHEEFSEWFSKDIENAAGGGDSGSLKPEQLRRLHMILKPFMLRRVKKHVQKELGDKIEIDLLVDLSQRQRSIYKALRQRVSISDLLAQAGNITDSSGAKNLMNLVMQFRKVCNHPDLFERADVVSPYVFGNFSHSGNLARQEHLYCPESLTNPIKVDLPRILWTDGGKLDVPSEKSLAGSDTKVLGSLMNIWSTSWINERSKQKKDDTWGFLKFMGDGPGDAHRKAKSHPMVSLLDGSLVREHRKECGEYESDASFAARLTKPYTSCLNKVPTHRQNPSLPALSDITTQSWNTSFLSRRESRFVVESVVAPYIEPVISNRSYLNTQHRLSHDPLVSRAIYGVTPSERENIQAVKQLAHLAPGVGPNGLLGASPHDQAPISSMRAPPIKRLIVDSAKLARLDDLLRELKDGGHRVLLYFQMTRMMDLVEEYLIYRQYKYLRLDGSSAIGERRDMVTSWQTNPDIFVFCLSTRAGGLGINLTAADTVVFYDHDWNPSNDAQAMDRAHRVGQTKQVTVYRLIARGTIEERILRMARAKKDVQDIVVGTKSLTDVAKPSEIVSLFMDDEELAESVAKRRQAEAHGYVAPTTVTTKKSAFGDGLGGGDEDEDDFFSLKKKVVNGEDEDFGDDDKVGGGSGKNTPKEGGGKKKAPAAAAAPSGAASKRKNAPDGEAKKPSKKKVRMGLGPDGLPL